MKIFQKLNYGFGGCDANTLIELGVISNPIELTMQPLGQKFWRKEDMKYLDKIQLSNISELASKFLLSKRALLLEDGTAVVVPHGELAMSMYLGKLAKLYFQYLEERKENQLEKFNNKLFVLRVEIAKRLFSKKFTEKYNFEFKGFSGVALSHSRSIDEIMVPEWFGLPIGSHVLVTRDPIQNTVAVLKISGHTANEIRVNPALIVMLGGDFDGDKIQVIPLGAIYGRNKELFRVTSSEFSAEMMRLKPSQFAFSELLEA